MESSDKLDNMIEDALRSETWRPAPQGLHGRIRKRIRIEALRARERRRFALQLSGAFMALTALIAVVGFAGQSEEFMYRLGDIVPGAYGYLDYAFSAMGPQTSALPALLAVIGTIAMASFLAVAGAAALSWNRPGQDGRRAFS